VRRLRRGHGRAWTGTPLSRLSAPTFTRQPTLPVWAHTMNADLTAPTLDPLGLIPDDEYRKMLADLAAMAKLRRQVEAECRNLPMP
jgi:hypothetical protein